MSKFHEKAFFKNVRKSWAKATRRSSEFAINMNKKLSPTGLTRAQLRDRGYEMIGSPVVESSTHANPFKFGWTSVGGNAIATDVMIKRDYRIPFEYVVFERGVREYYPSHCSISIISLFCVFQ